MRVMEKGEENNERKKGEKGHVTEGKCKGRKGKVTEIQAG